MRAVVAAVVVQVMSPFISAGVMNEPPVMREREREKEEEREDGERVCRSKRVARARSSEVAY